MQTQSLIRNVQNSTPNIYNIAPLLFDDHLARASGQSRSDVPRAKPGQRGVSSASALARNEGGAPKIGEALELRDVVGRPFGAIDVCCVAGRRLVRAGPRLSRAGDVCLELGYVYRVPMLRPAI